MRGNKFNKGCECDRWNLVVATGYNSSLDKLFASSMTKQRAHSRNRPFAAMLCSVLTTVSLSASAKDASKNAPSAQKPASFAAATSAAVPPNSASAQAASIAAIHARQQHHSLGSGDMYVAGIDVKWIFNDGDLYCLYRGEEHKVYLACSSKKAVFVCSFDQFRKRGITFTQGGQEAFRTVTLKPADKLSVFQKFPTKNYAALARANVGRGQVRMINIGSVTTLAQPTKTKEMAEFVTQAYGLPQVDALMLDMRTNFYVSDASIWFKTNDKDLAKPENPNNQVRLRTSRLENVKVSGDFFQAPKNFTLAKTQESILGMASAAKDFTDLMFAEPKTDK